MSILFNVGHGSRRARLTTRAWIETLSVMTLALSSAVARVSRRARGLKPLNVGAVTVPVKVARVSRRARGLKRQEPCNRATPGESRASHDARVD